MMRFFMIGIRKSKGSYDPGDLFAEICKRNSRFRGFQQQDAHDLLMNLLDFLDTEHDKFFKRSKIEKMMGLKQNIVENAFGGQFLSTVVCLECMKASRTKELMIEMSLTIQFKKNLLNYDKT